MRKILLVAAVLLFASILSAELKELNIYLIDVEGGGSTLLVGPGGESLLIDAGSGGHDDRDAHRIADLAKNVAHLKKIDYVLITHYHGDHIGGVMALSKFIPIGKYLDHGELTLELQKPEMVSWWKDYKALTGDDRTVLKAGDKIPMKGVRLDIVIADGKAITTPLKGGGPNPVFCKDAQQKPVDPDPENGSSIGTVLTYGHFRFADLGDMPWLQEQLLACPTNMIGHVDVYQTNHHGFDRSGSPQLVWALDPRVAIMNNGFKKAGHQLTFERIRKSPHFEDIWQSHFSLNAEKSIQSDEKMIANPDPNDDKGYWIQVTVKPSGKYTVTNGRNNFSKQYEARN